MFFKKNPEKDAIKKEIRELSEEITKERKLHSAWIKAFMAETNADMVAVQMVVIRKQAKRIAEKEYSLLLSKKKYSLL